MQEDSIALVTGSSAQVSVSQRMENGIEVLPFTIQMNGKVYSDGVDIEPREVYKAMRTSAAVPTTAPPSIGVFYQKFVELFDRGFHHIIYLTISRKLSGEYFNACSVADSLNEIYPDRQVHVVDSTVIASPQGFLAMGAAQCIKRGNPVTEVLQWLERTKERSGIVGSVETLDFLAKGGRIGKASHFLGSLLDIIPILSIKEGEVSPLCIKRGAKGLCNSILKIVQEIIQGYKKLTITVMHTDAPEKAAALQEISSKAFSEEKIPISDMNPMFGIHVGPGAFGLGYMFE